jgi:hypothetical protein
MISPGVGKGSSHGLADPHLLTASGRIEPSVRISGHGRFRREAIIDRSLSNVG